MARELLQTIIQPIRLYAKKDSSVVLALLGALKFMVQDVKISKENKEEVQMELQALKMDIVDSIENIYDRERIVAMFE
jgi:hypothetical protein